MIKVTIDGRAVEVEPGTTVLDAARKNGISIPSLCYLESTSPYGGCRLCLVEVEGMSKPMTACTLPCIDGMTVHTNNEKLKNLRRFSLQLILSEHPYSCLICSKKDDCAKYMECIEKEPITFGCKYCAKNHTCELQKLVLELEVREVPFGFHYRGLEVESYDPFFERDYNLCVLCGRCVRACAELRHASVIDFHHRGPKTLVGTAFNLSHIEARCQFCGACVDACPTGAMRERYSKYEEQPEKSVPTVCGLCSICCGININVRNNRIINCTPNNNPLCARGRFGLAQIVNHQKRVTVPLVKREGRIVEIGWDEALDYAVSKLSEYRGKIGIVFSPGLTIEAIDALTTVAELTGVEGFGSALGITGKYASACLEKRAKKVAFVVLNTNLLDDFAVMLLKFMRILEDRPVIISIDAIRTKLVDIADIWLRPKPGMENEILEVLLSGKDGSGETGILDKEITQARRMLAKRDVCVLCNPYNTGQLENLNGAHVFPLISTPNFQHIMNLDIMDSEQVLQNGSFECLYLIGTGPRLKRRYSTVIVQDVFLPDFEFDLFLPASTFAEVEGSLIDIEGKVKKLQKAIEPVGKSRSDDWIIKEITSRLDFEMISSRKEDAGVAEKPVRRIIPAGEYPYYLLVRENCYRFRNKPLSALLKGFERLRDDGRLHVNPQDAEKLKLSDGAEVKIKGHDLCVVMRTKITDAVPEGVVFAYHNPATGLLANMTVKIERG